MTTKDNGGPAFPTKSYDFEREAWVREEGMTLRDYFAAKAMQSYLPDGIHESDFARTAFRAYKMADVMLEARKK